VEDILVPGAEPRIHDRDLAALALAVYDKENAGSGRWTRVTDERLRDVGIYPGLLENPQTSFRAGIFSDGKHHVLAFAGTDEWKEVATNIGQALGFNTEQHTAAVALSRQAKRAYGKDLVLTGHSLGGGLASLAAASVDVEAVTFNAAGLHRNSIERNDLDVDYFKQRASDGLIRAYSVKGEILTRLQDAFPLPQPPGERIDLADPAPLKGFRSVLPVSRAVHTIKLHSMKSVIAAMDKDPRFVETRPELAKAMEKQAGDFLKQSGMSEKSIGLVTKALARKIETEKAAGRFPTKSPLRDLGRSR
jgi:hypothetical protein